MSWFKESQRWYDPDAPGEIEELPEEQEMPVVTPENIGEYIDPEEDEQYEQTQFPPETYPEEETQTTFLDEMPGVYDDDQSIIEEAIEDQQCIAFEYTTKRGVFTGFRLLEPVGQWTTINTHNLLVVGFDRARQAIRAFLVENIHPGTLKVMPGEFYSFEPRFIFNPQY